MEHSQQLVGQVEWKDYDEGFFSLDVIANNSLKLNEETSLTPLNIHELYLSLINYSSCHH